jgi:hypothetical protein
VPAASLRTLREQSGHTQGDLAVSVGRSRASEIETLALNRQRIDTLRRYVEALGGKLVVSLAFDDVVVVLQSPPRTKRTRRPRPSSAGPVPAAEQ